MRRCFASFLIALGCMVVAGCVQQTVGPADLPVLLRSGQPLLNCHEPCLAQWQASEPEAAQLAASASWQELALLLLRVRYQDDLTLFYLARAAEGLGYPAAALGYYRLSAALSGTASSCHVRSRQCGRVALPRAAELRVAALEPRLYRPARPRPAAPSEPATPSPEPAAEVPEAPVAPFFTPEMPPARPPGPAESEYLEPPPARH